MRTEGSEIESEETNGNSVIKRAIVESIKIHQSMLDSFVPTLIELASLVERTFRQHGILYLLGNGGSAAQAQHVATEFIVRFKSQRRALPAIALTSDTAVITAAANDFDYTQIFSRQVEALVKSEDLLVVFSTSGASNNVLEAVRAGRGKGATTVGFTGSAKSELCELVDVAVQVPTIDTQRIQEAHLLLWHIICELVDDETARKGS